MSNYIKTFAMKGEKPFKCYVCGKVLLVDVSGEYIIKLNCPRCKTCITLECREPIPAVLAVKHGELVNF